MQRGDGPDDSPENALKTRVQMSAQMGALDGATRTLTTIVHNLEKANANTYQQADSALVDVNGEIAKIYEILETFNIRINELESGTEKKGALTPLCAERNTTHMPK